MDNVPILPVTQPWMLPLAQMSLLVRASRLYLTLATCSHITSLSTAICVPPCGSHARFRLSLLCVSIPVTTWLMLALTNPISPCSCTFFLLQRAFALPACHPSLCSSLASLHFIISSIICLSSLSRSLWPFFTQCNIFLLWLRYQLWPLTGLCHSLLPGFQTFKAPS